MTAVWILWYKQPNDYIGFEVMKRYPRQSKLDSYQARRCIVRVVKVDIGTPLGAPTYSHS